MVTSGVEWEKRKSRTGGGKETKRHGRATMEENYSSTVSRNFDLSGTSAWHLYERVAVTCN